MEEVRASRGSAGPELLGPQGSAYALIGANGAGKTTTIRILMNILEAGRGNATVLGVDSRRISPRELAQIGYVSENQDMPARLTVAEYLDYLRPFYPERDTALEASILAQLRLPARCKIGDLSHGMRMKMALACALPFRPKLLVLDEPFSGLGRAGARRIHGKSAGAGGRHDGPDLFPRAQRD